MKITTETLSKEVVSLLIRGREVVNNQVQVDDDKIMTKINDSWVLITAKAAPNPGITKVPKLSVAQRERAVIATLTAQKGVMFTTRELAEQIENVNNDQLGYVTAKLATDGFIQRQKRKSGGPHGVDVWEYYL